MWQTCLESSIKNEVVILIYIDTAKDKKLYTHYTFFKLQNGTTAMGK